MGCVMRDGSVPPVPDMEPRDYLILYRRIDFCARPLIWDQDERADFVSDVLCFRIVPHLYDAQGNLRLPSYSFVRQAVLWAWQNKRKQEQARGPLYRDSEVKLDNVPCGGDCLDPAQLLEANETFQRLWHELTPLERDAYWLTYVENKSVRAAAEQLGVTSYAVRTASKRAYHEIMKILRE